MYILDDLYCPRLNIEYIHPSNDVYSHVNVKRISEAVTVFQSIFSYSFWLRSSRMLDHIYPFMPRSR